MLPFVVESELRSIEEVSTSRATGLILSLQEQIDEHEVELTEMIEALTTDQMESLRTTIEYLWGKSYSKEVFNKSTLLKLMREQLNLRQKDIQWGKREGITEGRREGRTEGITEGITEGRTKERAERMAQVISVFQLMLQEGKLSHEQMEYFLNHMKEADEKKEQKSSANINE